jgi:Spy/CpxP family protein refolding chaperone
MTFRRSSAAVGLALALAAGVAQAQQPAQPDGRPRAGAARGGRATGRMQPGRALLRGITLTDAQKQRMRAINEKYRTEGKSLRESMRPAMEEARAARQRGDTAAARQSFARTADQRRQFTALQERRVAEVRSVLTADQQRQFDANRTELQSRMQERRSDARGKGHGGRGRGRAG